MSINDQVRGCVVLVLMLPLAGCGSGLPRLVPVSGKVTVDDKPLVQGRVNFYPTDENKDKLKNNPMGMIKPDGTYEMQTAGQPGAPLGAYKVTVSSMVPPGKDVSAMDPAAAMKNAVPLDPSFNNPDSTPLNVTVVDAPAAGAYDLQVKGK